MALRRYVEKGRLEAGCDETGRGCLAGPVCAAAVILPGKFRLPHLNDSKLLLREEREKLEKLILRQALSWSVALVPPDEIDRINILQASVLAMHKALEGLETAPEFILVDGNYFRPFGNLPHQCFIKGDSIYASIAAASILAKTARDRYMQELHPKFPYYSWHSNKGYPTIAHREAIIRHGITIHHRRSFRLYAEEDGQLGIFDEELSSMD